jgi:hypothetical protein
MCTAAATLPDLYLAPGAAAAAAAAAAGGAPAAGPAARPPGLMLPPAELHLRLRGRVDVFEAGQAARLDCNEM